MSIFNHNICKFYFFIPFFPVPFSNARSFPVPLLESRHFTNACVKSSLDTLYLLTQYFSHIFPSGKLVNQFIQITDLPHQRFFDLLHPDAADHALDQLPVLI